MSHRRDEYRPAGDGDKGQPADPLDPEWFDGRADGREPDGTAAEPMHPYW